MVVLAAAIVTKNGKALVSRQFVEISRIRIEGLLAAFPKLVAQGQQHTYVDTDTVRYLYQPLENMYLVLVTNRASNILEDLDTLRLCGKVVTDVVQTSMHHLPLECADEEAVRRAAYDLIFSFDEIVSTGGFKETVTEGQVKQNTAMDSNEEKLHRMIIQNKINETKDVMRNKAQEIDKRKMEAKAGRPMGGGSMGPGGGGGMGAGGYAPPAPPSPVRGDSGYGRPDFGGERRPPSGQAPRRGGLQLGKAGQSRGLMESLKAEGEDVAELGASGATATREARPAAAATPQDPVFVAVEESVRAALTNEGRVLELEIQGGMTLTVNAEERALVRVAVGSTHGWQERGDAFKTHPNINRELFAERRQLGLRDADRPFPVGTALGVLKWRFTSRSLEDVPLVVSAWPSTSGDLSYVTLEYERKVEADLHDVEISVPCAAVPKVAQVDGEWRHDPRRAVLVWAPGLVDASNARGTMEFSCPAADSRAFFPIHVSFTARRTLRGVGVEDVLDAQTGEPVPYGSTVVLRADDHYFIEG